MRNSKIIFEVDNDRDRMLAGHFLYFEKPKYKFLVNPLIDEHPLFIRA
jgi:hypothetical protein